MTRTRWAMAGLCVATACGESFGACPPIAEIAPPGAMVVAGVDEFQEMWEEFDGSFLGALWRDREMEDWYDRFLKDSGMAEDFSGSGPGELLDEAMELAGLRREELGAPTGVVGGAIWWGRRADTDDEGILWALVSDFGEDADEMRELVDSMMTVLDEEENLEVDEDEHAGSPVWRIEYTPADEDPADAAADEWDDWDVNTGPMIDHAHVSWIGGTLVIAGDRSALERAADRIDGVDMETLADGREFDEAMRMHDGARAYMVAFVAPMLDAFVPTDVGEEFLPVRNLLDTLGITEIRTASVGMRFDGVRGALEQSFGVAVPEKNGLVALFDTKLDSFAPPALVSADASTVYMFGFDWSGVMPMLNRMVEGIPNEEMRTQAQLSLGMFAGGVGPLMEGMRRDSVVVQSIRRPYSPDSQRMFAALGVHDEQRIRDGVQQMSPMLGFAPRDFMGNQIWESQLGAALGLGFGRLFVGTSGSVEDAMRQAGRDGATALSDEPVFRDAVSDLRPGGMLYSFTNNRETYGHMVWSLLNREMILRAQLEEFGLEEEMIRQIIEDQKDADPLAGVKPPPEELIFRYVGDATVMEAHSTPDGFRGRSLTFPASD